MDRLSEAEENGYQGTYFPPPIDPSSDLRGEGYISSSSPILSRAVQRPHDHHMPETDVETEVEHSGFATEPETPFLEAPPGANMEVDPGAETDPGIYSKWKSPVETPDAAPPSRREEEVGEIVFFEYGVVVFFGLSEQQERDILEDVDNAGIMKRKIVEDDWEIEECHFTHDPLIAYPRIYNDFFSEYAHFNTWQLTNGFSALKSRSHLLKLSISHALAQSTLLARYETTAQRVLSSPLTRSIPMQLATSGALKLRRNEALKLTGRLFKLRRDVNLVSNVLDVPELFWSEASLKDLYDAVREYMEIKPRVQVLNEKLGVASDFVSYLPICNKPVISL